LIGSFTAVGLYSVFGLTPSTGAVGLIFRVARVLVVSMIVCGSLNTLIERRRVQAAARGAEARPVNPQRSASRSSFQNVGWCGAGIARERSPT